MSDTSKGKTTRKPKGARVVTFNTVREQYAEKRGKNVTEAAKSLRGQLRAHRADLLPLWPALKDHEKGNQYPPMPATLANAIVAKGVSGAVKGK